MIRQLLDRDFLIRHFSAFGPHLDNEAQLLKNGDAGALQRAAQKNVTVDDLHQASALLKDAQTAEAADKSSSEPAFLARHPVTSAFQTALQQHLLDKQPAMVGLPKPLVPGNDAISDLNITMDPGVDSLYEQFGPRDLGWISVRFAGLLKLFRGTRAFTPDPAPPLTIGNSARLILLADWGTGVPRARKVGVAARNCLQGAANSGIEVHVIHLGDVYYSGLAEEYDDHFLPFWPVQPDEADKYGSWSLNGNHDMYSGGQGYFDHLLADPRFARQKQSSYFSLENDFWQVMGLDTAYTDYDLHGNQPNWLLETRAAQPGKKGLLLGHHQPFSDYEPPPDTAMLLKRVQPLLDRKLVTAWIWGHEHRCAFYKNMRNGIPFGRCMGHSGVPVFAPSAPAPQTVLYEFGDWVVGSDPHFNRFGFAVLDCDGATIHAQYIDEDGTPHYLEDFA